MPRRPRPHTGGLVFHVMNRSVRQFGLFADAEDYAAFAGVLREAVDRMSMRLLAYCVMPNHWHLVTWPAADGDLARFMKWMTAVHVQRWHRARATGGTGTIYQGRYKAVPVKDDHHLVVACRYVERNPVRAGLTERASEWPWSSAVADGGWPRPRLAAWPVPRPESWADLLEAREPEHDLGHLRTAIRRSTPFGPDAWSVDTARRLGWRMGVRPKGRPRKAGTSAPRPAEVPEAQLQAR